MYISRALLREQKPFRISSLEASGERSAQSLPILDEMNHPPLPSAIRPRCRRGYSSYFAVASACHSLYLAGGRGVARRSGSRGPHLLDLHPSSP